MKRKQKSPNTNPGQGGDVLASLLALLIVAALIAAFVSL